MTTFPGVALAALATLFPNDPELAGPRGWALERIQAPRAWVRRTDASSVVIAVVDSGIDLDHPDLRANLWVNPREIAGNGRDDDGNGYVDDVHGVDSYLVTGDPQDTVGHGTLVAGVIAAEGNNGVGGAGVLWKARLMAIRGEDGTHRLSIPAIVKGALYAADHGARIINASWGSYTPSSRIRELLEELDARGVLVVNAVGDHGLDIEGTPHYPSSYRTPNLVNVTVSDRDDRVPSWSNRGARTAHLAAPGFGVLTTKLGGGATVERGTSVAAPFVTAAAALVWAEHPELSHHEVRERVLRAVDLVAGMEGMTATGGRLNLAKALQD